MPSRPFMSAWLIPDEVGNWAGLPGPVACGCCLAGSSWPAAPRTPFACVTALAWRRVEYAMTLVT